MTAPDVTCWTLVRGAARGSPAEREAFASRYLPVIRAYLAARWRGMPLTQEVDDAVQAVFVDCFREGGALERADPARPFRAFLYGVIRNVALRREDLRRRRQRERQPQDSAEPEVDDVSLARTFDAAWAQSIMDQAAVRMTEHAHASGARAVRRLDLLKLRFQEDLPIREIARLWDADPAHLHREYAKARGEFREALVEVVAEHHPGTRPQVEAEAAGLITFF